MTKETIFLLFWGLLSIFYFIYIIYTFIKLKPSYTRKSILILLFLTIPIRFSWIIETNILLITIVEIINIVVYVLAGIALFLNTGTALNIANTKEEKENKNDYTPREKYSNNLNGNIICLIFCIVIYFSFEAYFVSICGNDFSIESLKYMYVPIIILLSFRIYFNNKNRNYTCANCGAIGHVYDSDYLNSETTSSIEYESEISLDSSNNVYAKTKQTGHTIDSTNTTINYLTCPYCHNKWNVKHSNEYSKHYRD